MASKFKVKRRDGLLLAVFYAVVGILQLAALTLDEGMMWIGALALLSLIAAYGLFSARKWSVWLVIMLFFPQVVFGAYSLYGVATLYPSSPGVSLVLLEAGLVVFIVLSFVSSVYVTAKRETFEAA
jgi:hypothetical protein